MRALVTGGAGFIGSWLCEKLIERGNFAICFDNFSTGSKDNLKNILNHKNFKLINGDILDVQNLKKAISENSIDIVFHFAAVVGVKRTLENPLQVLNTNIIGTKNVLESSLNCKKLIFTSSSEVYGEPLKIPESEDGPLNSHLPYAVSKLVGEKYCRAYFDEFGLKATSLRLFNVYGPKQISSQYGFVTTIFINRVLKNLQPIIYGDGNQTRDFTFIEDCINAIISTAEKKNTDGIVLNIGTGKSVSINELAEKIIKISGKNLKPKHVAPREHDIRNRLSDITKMKKVLRFTPKISLEEGLKKTIEWYKSSQ